jgi:hypothetical protein
VNLAVPEKVRGKLTVVQEDARALVSQAKSIIIRPPYRAFSFRYESSVPRDILTRDERAQSLCFVTRYDALQTVTRLTLREENGDFYIANLQDLRSALNEFRPVIMNQKDSMYYAKIHMFCRQKLTNNDPTKDMTITVMDENERNVTSEFVKYLDQRIKAVRKVISNFDFDYVYNGILQHSDHAYTTRYLNDYASGELNYVFIRHHVPLPFIKDCLSWHYRLISQLTFPSLGPL